MPYNRIRIRELILEAFSDEELLTFCQDHFGEAVNQFSSATSKETKARELIGWCERREKMQDLLAQLKVERPEKYARYSAELENNETLLAPSIGNIQGTKNQGPTASIESTPQQIRTDDIYTSYEAGQAELLRRLAREDPRYADALVYQQRLYDNLAQSRRYGETETRKAERAVIIDQLNRLSLSTLGVSFNELCGLA
jgi:hypothetical protein